jgi:hypothetical protein
VSSSTADISEGENEKRERLDTPSSLPLVHCSKKELNTTIIAKKSIYFNRKMKIPQQHIGSGE